MSRILNTRPRQITLAVVVAALIATALIGNGNSGSPPSSTMRQGSTSAPQGDYPESPHPGVNAPDAGKLAGAPVPTARQFVGEWLNRTHDAAELRRQLPVLVGTATGTFAQLTQVTIDDALATGEFGPTNQGTVEFAKAEPANGDNAAVLLVCRERAGDGAYAITTYIARLAKVRPGAFALTALEPQG